jgi:hypothetical protein
MIRMAQLAHYRKNSLFSDGPEGFDVKKEIGISASAHADDSTRYWDYKKHRHQAPVCSRAAI